MPRGDDEHMSVPTWRMRQLQDIEQAALEVVELIGQTEYEKRSAFEREVSALLSDAIEGPR
jgi:hypothetical protein